MRHPWIGIALPRLCLDVGLAVVTIVPVTTVFDTLKAADQVLGLGRVSQRAVDHGLMTATDRQRWLHDLASRWTAASVTLFLVGATKGAAPAA